MSQMMVGMFSLLWFLYSQKIKMILSVCAALITINDSSCYFIVNFFLVKWFAALILLVCCFECLLC